MYRCNNLTIKLSYYPCLWLQELHAIGPCPTNATHVRAAKAFGGCPNGTFFKLTWFSHRVLLGAY